MSGKSQTKLKRVVSKKSAMKGGNEDDCEKSYGEGSFGKLINYCQLSYLSHPTASLQFYDQNDILITNENQLSKIKAMCDKKELLFKYFHDQDVNTKDSYQRHNFDPLQKELMNMKTVIKLGIQTCCIELNNQPRSVLLYAKTTLKNGEIKLLPIYERYDMSLLDFVVDHRHILPFNFITKISKYILKTLKVLHDNDYYHFDITPKNIMVKVKPFKIMIIDYGTLTHVSEYRQGGSPMYWSPITTMRYDCPSYDKYCQEMKQTHLELKRFYTATIIDISELFDSFAEGDEPDIETFCKNRKTSTQNFACHIGKRKSEVIGKQYAEKIRSALNQICQEQEQNDVLNTQVCHTNAFIQTRAMSDRQDDNTNTEQNSKIYNNKYKKKDALQAKHDVEVLAKELKKVIYQKDELFGVGWTLRDLLKLQLYRQKHEDQDSYAQEKKNSNNRRFNNTNIHGIPYDNVEEIPKDNITMIFMDKLIKARLFEGDPYEEDFFSCDEALDFLEKNIQQINAV